MAQDAKFDCRELQLEFMKWINGGYMEALDEVSFVMSLKNSGDYTAGDAERELIRCGVITADYAEQAIASPPTLSDPSPKLPFNPRELYLEFMRWIGSGYIHALDNVNLYMSGGDYTVGQIERELIRHGVITADYAEQAIARDNPVDQPRDSRGTISQHTTLDAGREIPQLPNTGNQMPQSPLTPRELQLEFSSWVGLGYMEALQHVSLLMNIKDSSKHYILGDAESELLRYGIISNEDAGREIPQLPNTGNQMPQSPLTPRELQLEFSSWVGLGYMEALQHISLLMNIKGSPNYYTLGDAELELLRYGIISR